ncbi:MAG: error-prone DNA polymerase [Hyphomicrobiales bacterium]|nr:error-prone DNA polymerase [Hyphomicrobiales bacterium]
MTAYAELCAATHFSFLRGASAPSDMVLTALLLGLAGIGIADRNSVAGVVRAHAALRELRAAGNKPPQILRDGGSPGEFVVIEPDAPPLDSQKLAQRAQDFKLLTGARLCFHDETPDIVVYPENRAGWGRLCRILTSGNRRAKKGACILTRADLLMNARDLLMIVLPNRDHAGLAECLSQLRIAAEDRVWLGATMPRRGDDRRRLAALSRIARASGAPLIAVNDALYASPDQRDLQDVLTCIREGVKLTQAGRALETNAERHLKPPHEMARLFADAPQAIAQTLAFLDRAHFSLDQLKYEYPDEPTPPGREPQQWLEELTWRHAAMRYPAGVPARVEAQLRDELALIGKLDYARYFLTIHDIVRIAHDKGILCQGRGSAANSAVCFVLGITAVDPAEYRLLFARFLSEERREPPDIDVDFEHERREEIIQHIYQKYGRERAGLVATVISYRPRSAIRDVGKVFGLSEDVTGAIADTNWGSYGRDIPDARVRETGVDPANPTIARAVSFARRLIGFPRHLSQHVGGFVLARGRLDEICPIGNAAMKDRTFIEWDKDDIDTLGLMKVDVLALGMLTCIRKALDALRAHEATDWTLADIPQDDAQTYAMLQRGESLGVFQVESRAQMNMLPRLKPEKFYDLVIQVAIVRPGPIQGNMVHPYLRRRSGAEKVKFPAPSPQHGPPDELRQVLGRTMGVPLFQEQAMELAMVAAKFSADEANQLRRAMATFRNVGTIHHFEAMMVERMIARGYDPDFARNCFEQIRGFGSYGFPESHAASFAKLVYVSAYIKQHHPAIFACALLNAQPMGFYAPAQIVRDAQENGVEARAPDVNSSDWDNKLVRNAAGALALQLGFRQIDGLAQNDMERLVAMRKQGYASVEELSRRAALSAQAMRLLADADAFRSFAPSFDRRKALWAVRRLPAGEALPLFAAADARELAREPSARLPQMPLGEQVATDYQTMRLSLKAHPMKLLRSHFAGVATCAGLRDLKDGAWARVAGLVLVRQRPGAGNAIFVTLEDETGVANLLIWARDFERIRRPVMGARLMLATGRVQKSDEGVVHLMTKNVRDDSLRLENLWRENDDSRLPHTSLKMRHPRDVRLLPRSRDFR